MMVLGPVLPENLVYLDLALFIFWNFRWSCLWIVRWWSHKIWLSCQWNIFSTKILLLKIVSSFKFRFLNMITVCFCLTYSFKNMSRREPLSVQASPSPYCSISLFLVEGAETEFCLPVKLKDESPKYMRFGLSPGTKLAKFIRLLGSKSVAILLGRLFTLILSVQKDVKFRSWAGDPSTEVFNGSMFLHHFAKLDWLLQLVLKTSTLTLGVM